MNKTANSNIPSVFPVLSLICSRLYFLCILFSMFLYFFHFPCNPFWLYITRLYRLFVLREVFPVSFLGFIFHTFLLYFHFFYINFFFSII